jgi:dTDP-4-amino-4,6-dideoxygalactose transaminase
LDDGTLKSTEAALNRSLCLPMHVELNDEEAGRIATALVEEVRKQIG